MSPAKAKLQYWKQVFSLIFSYAIRRRKAGASFHAYASTNSIDMLKNYFTIAVRSLSKHKFFTTLNVLGLSIGMSVSLLLVAMISYVARYDTFHVQQGSGSIGSPQQQMICKATGSSPPALFRCSINLRMIIPASNQW